MPDVSVLDVLLYNEPIGTLTRVPGDRTLFAFNQDYIDDPDRPALSLSFKDALGHLIMDFQPTRTRLLPFFANLLPEGRMRDYLAERAGVNPQREFFLLWALGKDLPGALTIRSAEGEAWPPGGDHDADHDEDDRRRNALRFSLAGVQLKFSAISEASGGLTIPAEGVGGSWIVKLPSMTYEGVPENEFAMMRLAAEIGMDVPEVWLVEPRAIAGLPEGIGALKGPALAVKRFDRSADRGPVHTEDFAQVFNIYPEAKYKKASYRNIAKVIWVETGEAGIAEFTRRLVFNTLIGNADMHLKNWSLIYPDRRNAALAPGYDFVSTIPYIPDKKAALKYARTKRMDEVSEEELAYLAAKARLPKKLVLDTARETVTRFRDVWSAEKKNLPLSENLIETIEAHAETIPIAGA
jgi:serine/threonine-protein kinase HipA